MNHAIGRPSLSASAASRNGDDMVTIREILTREKWASEGGLRGLEVAILHRGAPGDMKVIQGEWIIDVAPRAMLISEGPEESVIPYHRVRIIRRGATIIWQRAARQRKT